MKKLEILLVCGGGFSSGFMANALKKAAANHDIDMHVQAKSETATEDYIEDVDAIMVGPHMAYVMSEMEELTNEYGVSLILMKPDYYKALDGEKCLEHLLSVLKEEGKYE